VSATDHDQAPFSSRGTASGYKRTPLSDLFAGTCFPQLVPMAPAVSTSTLASPVLSLSKPTLRSGGLLPVSVHLPLRPHTAVSAGAFYWQLVGLFRLLTTLCTLVPLLWIRAIPGDQIVVVVVAHPLGMHLWHPRLSGHLTSRGCLYRIALRHLSLPLMRNPRKHPVRRRPHPAAISLLQICHSIHLRTNDCPRLHRLRTRPFTKTMGKSSPMGLTLTTRPVRPVLRHPHRLAVCQVRTTSVCHAGGLALTRIPPTLSPCPTPTRPQPLLAHFAYSRRSPRRSTRHPAARTTDHAPNLWLHWLSRHQTAR
jgi:hypothetical protein